MSSHKERSAGWIGVEAYREGLPVLLRLRLLSPPIYSFQQLLVIDWNYTSDSTTQLPGTDFYTIIDDFENNGIGPLEAEGRCILVCAETGLGICRHYIYCQDSQAIGEALDESIEENRSVELSAADDPLWTAYKRLLKSSKT